MPLVRILFEFKLSAMGQRGNMYQSLPADVYIMQALPLCSLARPVLKFYPIFPGFSKAVVDKQNIQIVSYLVIGLLVNY